MLGLKLLLITILPISALAASAIPSKAYQKDIGALKLQQAEERFEALNKLYKNPNYYRASSGVKQVMKSTVEKRLKEKFIREKQELDKRHNLK